MEENNLFMSISICNLTTNINVMGKACAAISMIHYFCECYEFLITRVMHSLLECYN